MRISYRWLSEYVDLPPAEELAPQGAPGKEGCFAAVKDLAARLTAVGLEVEAIERTGANLGGVVAARVVASEWHPDAM